MDHGVWWIGAERANSGSAGLHCRGYCWRSALQNLQPDLGCLKTNHESFQVCFATHNFLHMSHVVSEFSNAFEVCVEISACPKHFPKYAGLTNQVGYLNRRQHEILFLEFATPSSDFLYCLFIVNKFEPLF